MSHYSQLVTDYKDEKALVCALIDMGFLKSDIQVSVKPVQLDGAGGMANIVIRKATIREKVKYAYTDLGFEKLSNGFYKAHIDSYTFDKTWKNKLHQRYDYRLRMEQLRLSGHQLTETVKPDGTIVVMARR